MGRVCQRTVLNDKDYERLLEPKFPSFSVGGVCSEASEENHYRVAGYPDGSPSFGNCGVDYKHS